MFDSDQSIMEATKSHVIQLICSWHIPAPEHNKKFQKAIFCWSLLPPVVRTLIYGFLDPVIRSSDLLKGKCAISQKKASREEKEETSLAPSKSNFQQWCGDTSKKCCRKKWPHYGQRAVVTLILYYRLISSALFCVTI